MTQEQRTAFNRKNAESRERYNSATYDKVTIRIRKDGGDGVTLDDIRRAAERNGQSLNAFVLDSIKEKI